MNVLICIGCDRYDSLDPLGGAEKDARSVFETLVSGDFYDKPHSKLLCSPRKDETEKALASIWRGKSLDVFTFFFAGHAGGKDGSFFLALSDSDLNALSVTAFPLTRLFDMVNEFKPRQVNIVVDGCEAGGSTSSVRTLFRPENVGTTSASSVAFLGACSASEGAGESDEGGALTTHLIRAIKGEADLVLHSPLIELADLSASVSEAVTSGDPSQHPVFWALNLYGRRGFAKNPHFHIDSPLPSLSLTSVTPDSEMGRRISEFSAELWEEYRLISREFDPARLLKLLQTLLSAPDLEASDRAAVISGLVRSFSSVAASEGELLAQPLTVATCLVALLPWWDDPAVRTLVKQELELDFTRTGILFQQLRDEIQVNESRLFGTTGLAADLYYLPVRITRLLGLIGTQAIIGRLLGFETDDSRAPHREFVTTLLQTYPKLLVALDDEQAAPLYIFLKAARLCGWNEIGAEVVQNYYIDAAVHGGTFNRLDSDGAGALEHLLILIKSELAMQNRSPANPSSLLPIIILGGMWFDCGQEWDLSAFDRRNIGLFLPEDYRDFSQEIIARGITHTWKIGFGVWQPEQLFAEFNAVIRSRESDAVLSVEAHCLCVLAALLFPDRIPLNLESSPSSLAMIGPDE